MNEQVLKTLEKYRMLDFGDSVIVALSGGADSVSLLDVLCSVKEKYNLTVYAAHLNHKLRGEEAERDENFCKILCENYNIQLFTKAIDIRTLSKKLKISEELCGRNERYKFFDELSKSLNAKVATAHTASDNAETLIYNITRGSSVRGLSAIPPKRENIIRPLIEVSRRQIEDYCKANNLKYVTDSTNLADEYTRNKIRHSVIKPLKEINPRFEQAVSCLSENARELTDYLNRQSEIAIASCKTQYGYSCEKLLKLDSVILKHSLVLLCEKTADLTPEHKHIELMLDIIRNGGAVELQRGISAVSKQGIFRLIFVNDKIEFTPVLIKDNLHFNFNCKLYSVETIASDRSNINSVSVDVLKENAVFRTRREGDRFTYPRRKVTKPLRKVLNELKIPSEQRDKLIVLAIDNKVLWCENVGASLEGKNNSEKEFKVQIIY